MLRKIFDSDNSSGWLLLSTLIVLIGMFIALFIPMLSTLFRFQLDTKVGYTPNESAIWFLFAAFLALALGFFFVYRLREKSIRIVSAIVGALLFVYIAFVSFNQYIYVDYSYIQIGSALGAKKYEWEDVEAASFYRTSDGIESYVLEMKDGKEIETVFGGALNTGAKVHIKRSVEATGVVIVDRS